MNSSSSGEMKKNLRIVHTVVDDVYMNCLSKRTQGGSNSKYSQKVYEPEMTPFAIAGGKRACASCVNGYDRRVNSTGGITSLRLYLVRG